MANSNKKENIGRKILSAIMDNSLAVMVVVIVLMFFLPIPKVLVDVAMTVNLALSLVILLTVIYTKRAAEFSSFPFVILFTTLFGLAINVSSTRLMLVNPVTGSGSSVNMSGQSEMVKSFSSIVAGDNVVVGFVIFIILIIVQVVVVTKGAGRVSEVSARFTLDAMNSKMFDIQNEVNAGTITEEEAAKRKALIRKEIDFYSAMDGSSKFVSGNVKTGIAITVLNLIGGMISGMVFGKMSFLDAMNSYAKLTIGDGLMSQLPALMISFATGILVTSSSSDEFLGDELKKEFSANGTVYVIVGAALLVMGVVFHNMSAFVLLPIGGLLVYYGVRLLNLEKKNIEKQEAELQASKAQKQKGSSPDDLSPVVTLDPLSLDLGYALVPLVDREKGAELLERVTRIRRESALELGLVVPPIRIRDSMSIAPEEYSFKIRGIEAGRSKLKLGHYMCLNIGNVPKDKEIAGEPTKDPSFGMDAIWVPESRRVEAEKVGYAVIDPPTIIATHLTEIIRRHAADILSRQEVSAIIKKIKDTNPVVVDEVMSGESKYSYGDIEKILKNLLKEQVSIRNMVTILETLSNYQRHPRDITFLTERVREALGAQICLQYADENKVLHVVQLSQHLAEQIITHTATDSATGVPFVAFDPVDRRKYLEAVSSTLAAVQERNYIPIIVCAPEVRQLVKNSIDREMPNVIVLSIGEIMAAGPELTVETFGVIDVQ